MWICMNNSFLSVVADRNNPHRLLVRARMKGHIEAVFPKAQVFTDMEADYMYRAYVPRGVVAQEIAKQIEKIPYDNFKDSVEDDDLHEMYAQFWQLHFRKQWAQHYRKTLTG